MSTEQISAPELFAQLHGAWEGVTSTQFGPGAPVVENDTRASAYPGYHPNFLHFDYESAIEGQPFKGSFLFAWDTIMQQYQAAWTDQFHMSTGIMFCTGGPTDGVTQPGFSVLGSYAGEVGGELWGWRTEMVLEAPNRLRLTAYNITPAGEEFKGIETIFRRAG